MDDKPSPRLIALLFLADALGVAALFALLFAFMWGTP